MLLRAGPPGRRALGLRCGGAGQGLRGTRPVLPPAACLGEKASGERALPAEHLAGCRQRRGGRRRSPRRRRREGGGRRPRRCRPRGDGASRMELLPPRAPSIRAARRHGPARRCHDRRRARPRASWAWAAFAGPPVCPRIADPRAGHWHCGPGTRAQSDRPSNVPDVPVAFRVCCNVQCPRRTLNVPAARVTVTAASQVARTGRRGGRSLQVRGTVTVVRFQGPGPGRTRIKLTQTGSR